jgi:chromosome segregation ATPase
VSNWRPTWEQEAYQKLVADLDWYRSQFLAIGKRNEALLAERDALEEDLEKAKGDLAKYVGEGMISLQAFNLVAFELKQAKADLAACADKNAELRAEIAKANTQFAETTRFIDRAKEVLDA